MRDIDPALAAHLSTGTTTICRCWRLSRADGVVLGFTDHDMPLEVEGEVYAPDSGFDATGIESGIGLAVDNSEIAGALSSDLLSEEDILAGRYDGARVDLFNVNWSDPRQYLQVFRGTLGEIRRGTVGFEAELRSVSAELNRTIGRTYLPICADGNGEGCCCAGSDIPGSVVDTVVGEIVENRVLMIDGLTSLAEGWFANGAVHWTAGRNAGTVAKIKRDSVMGGMRRIELWAAAPLDIAQGDACRLTAGCAQTADAYRELHGNLVDFGGFPHIPGEDFVTAYPASGGGHTGGSRLG